MTAGEILGFFFGWIILIAMAIDYNSESEKLMAYNKSQHVALAAQEIYGMPASKPVTIVWNEDPDWPHSALANCEEWVMTLSLPIAKHSLDIMLNKVIPHEYGHFVHCFMHGNVGANPHGGRWQDIVLMLGGDPTFR